MSKKDSGLANFFHLFFIKNTFHHLSKIFFLLLLLNCLNALLPHNLYAANIQTNNIIGTASNGNQVTVTGIGFGNKTKAEPLSFINGNIENGINGSTFQANNWRVDTGANVPPKYTNIDAHSGNQSLLFPLRAPSASTPGWSQVIFDSGVGGHENWYFTTWVKLDKKDSCSTFQWKSWRLSSSPGYGVAEEPNKTSVILFDNWSYDNGTRWGNNFAHGYYNGGTSGGTASAPADQYLIGEWQRVEVFYNRALSPNQRTGTMTLRRVGRAGDLVHKTDYMTHDADDGIWRYLRLGQYYGNLQGCTSGQLDVFYDDIYIDNSIARIEIGNASNFDNCTQREIQEPLTWNDNSISVRFNQGGFNQTDNLYLFVINANGDISTGIPIQIGKTYTGTVQPTPVSLTSPSNLKIVTAN